MTAVPYPLTYVYQEDVPAEARSLQEQAAYKAYAYFSEFADLGEVTVYSIGDLDLYLDQIFPALKSDVPTISKSSFRNSWPKTGGVAAQHNIIVNTSYFVWQNDEAPCYRANNVAHEMFHIVQSELLQHSLFRPQLDYGPEWLKEGSAQVMGLRIADGLNGCSYERDGPQWWRTDSVDGVLLQSVEGGDFGAKPKFWSVAPLAVDYLIRIAPAGDQSLLDYYSAIGAGTRWPEAFLNSFGMSSDAFYQRFQTEVIAVLPTVGPTIQPAIASTIEPTATLPADAAHVTGTVILAADDQVFQDYVISFCNLEIVQCEPGAMIDASGSFSKDLAPGSYRISVVPMEGGAALGWYVDQGLVNDINCANVFTVTKNQAAAISISLAKGQCALAEGAVPVRGHVVLGEAATSYSDVFITFCKEDVEACLPGVPIDSDGAFETGLIPGKYRVSINSAEDSQLLGWYVSNGLAPSILCAKVVKVYVNQEVNITIQLDAVSCPT